MNRKNVRGTRVPTFSHPWRHNAGIAGWESLRRLPKSEISRYYIRYDWLMGRVRAGTVTDRQRGELRQLRVVIARLNKIRNDNSLPPAG